jgi:hypothetical protein
VTQEALSDNSDLTLRDSDVGIPTSVSSPDLTLRDGVVGIPTTPSLPCKLVNGNNTTNEGRLISGTYAHFDTGIPFRVIIDKSNGYVNATKICKAGGKDYRQWFHQKEIKS